MQETIRRAVAYAASGRVLGKFGNSVYSYHTASHTSMSPSYDYDAGAHISGMDSENLYHYGHGTHIQLTVTGEQFSGYDYESGSHFTGQVSGNNVQLYDYGTGRHYNYLV